LKIRELAENGIVRSNIARLAQANVFALQLDKDN